MRLDLYLVESGITESRTKAQRLISEGQVSVDGKIVSKPSFDVDGNEIQIIGDGLKYVSRGALKLEGALKAFGINPAGFRCVDIGSSTGGFTDCLLQHGAEHVFCVDSGSDQLHVKLRSDQRITLRENFNARNLTSDDVGYKADIVVMDVSFISQAVLYPNVREVISDSGIFISLIKPQFEVGKENIGKGGIVKSVKAHKGAIERLITESAKYGLFLYELIKSPITGGDGNIEYLAYFGLDSRLAIKSVSNEIFTEKLK